MLTMLGCILTAVVHHYVEHEVTTKLAVPAGFLTKSGSWNVGHEIPYNFFITVTRDIQTDGKFGKLLSYCTCLPALDHWTEELVIELGII
jgi:hypothetical protein